MTQQGLGFLEHLYQGRFQEDLLRFPRPDERKVEQFMQRFAEAVRDYSPENIEKQGVVPDELMAKLKEIGLFGLTIPAEYGGLGFSTSEYLRVVEKMAGHDMALVLVPLAHLSIGMKGITLFGTEEQKRRYLTAAASGEMVFAYALTEPKTGSDAQHIETKAELSEDGSHYIINGSKTYITNGNYAQGFTVFAQLDPQKPGYMGAFIVERAWEGVNVGKDMPKMGLKVSSTTPIQFKDVRVPKENLLAAPGDGFKIAMNILNYGRLGLGAASAGLMKQSLQDMSKRAESRKQFGVPIREFELIQEKLVRAKAHAYAASNMTYFTAGALEQEPLANVAIEGSHCKLYGTNECWNTLYDALQTAGGSGFIATQPYEKRMRDFRVTTIFEGTTEIHSIYPSLTLLRSLGKELAKRTNGAAKLAYLWSFGRTVALSHMAGGRPSLDRALQTARKSEKLLRTLVKKALTTYRKKVTEHEFLLRRITWLSLSLFWLVASVTALKRRFPDGDYPADELALLDYLVEEAREVQERDGHFKPDGLESAHHAVMSYIGADPGGTHP
ncbi:MAG: acyl-CoA dehydrogenase family protein [Spirochaetaceae bacterium]